MGVENPSFLWRYSVSPIHAIGNAYADKLADRAAAGAQLPAAVTADYRQQLKWIPIVQRRLLAILSALIRDNPRQSALPPPPAPPGRPLVLRFYPRRICVCSPTGAPLVSCADLESLGSPIAVWPIGLQRPAAPCVRRMSLLHRRGIGSLSVGRFYTPLTPLGGIAVSHFVPPVAM